MQYGTHFEEDDVLHEMGKVRVEYMGLFSQARKKIFGVCNFYVIVMTNL